MAPSLWKVIVSVSFVMIIPLWKRFLAGASPDIVLDYCDVRSALEQPLDAVI